MAFLASKSQPFKLDLFFYQSFLLLMFFLTAQVKSAASPLPICQKPTFKEALLVQVDQCSSVDQYSLGVVGGHTWRVAEVNGTILERTLHIAQSRNDAYVAVLFYAKWCPFSKSLRSTFHALSLFFPAVYHVAVEESDLRPSGLSQYGVHSLPSLFLQNKKLKIRYYGPRTVGALGHFYKDITGLQPISVGTVKEEMSVRKQKREIVPKGMETYPLSLMKNLEKLLEDDMYLVLAALFLVLRVAYCIFPKVAECIKHYWVKNAHVLQAAKAVMRRELLLHADQQKYAKRNRIDGGKGLRTGKLQPSKTIRRGPYVNSWSSSSLAPVTLAEGSSSRGGCSDEVWERGRGERGHIMG
eukprot:c25766_g1_i1 orf=744-1808(+)